MQKIFPLDNLFFSLKKSKWKYNVAIEKNYLNVNMTKSQK